MAQSCSLICQRKLMMIGTKLLKIILKKLCSNLLTVFIILKLAFGTQIKYSLSLISTSELACCVGHSLVPAAWTLSVSHGSSCRLFLLFYLDGMFIRNVVDEIWYYRFRPHPSSYQLEDVVELELESSLHSNTMKIVNNLKMLRSAVQDIQISQKLFIECPPKDD